MTETAEAVVIGGGINGVAIAFHLARRGVRPLLIEKTFIAGGPTGRSTAFIRQHYSNEVTARMAHKALRFFQNFEDIVEGACDFRQCGYIFGAAPDHLEIMRSNVAMLQSLGIDSRMISIEEVREREPALYTDDLAGAAWEPEAGYADPATTATSLAKAAKRMGGRLMLGTLVTEVVVENGRVTGVRTEKGEVHTDLVVAAAGPWTAALLAPQADLPIRNTRAESCIFRLPPNVSHRVSYSDFIGKLYMRPETGEQMLVGSLEDPESKVTVPDPDRFDDGVSFSTIEKWSGVVAHRYPAMEQGHLGSSYASLYDVTPDCHSILDAMPGAKGLYVAAGSSGHGFKLAPVVGEMMAGLILDGKKESDEIAHFSLARFREGRLMRGKYELGIIG